jgi:mannosylglycerate hydrolase
MLKTQKTKEKQTKRTSKTRAQCHFISNTHWDREWRFSMQRTRHMLVYMMDMLLDIFAKEPKFKSFHLDSQTVPLQDYLEIRPEREELLKKYVQEKRLYVGPWFCLPDEFSVAGESLVRNLLLGHKIANKFGHVSKTGYSPFGWGQISQMPQIYTGFAINFAAFYRGINSIVAPNAEYMWEGSDGTKIVASRLGLRPRYNVWYVIQRPVFWNQHNENNRVMSWKDGHGPFKFVDETNAGLDMQYVHPRFDYFKKNVAQRAEQAYNEQDGDWTTVHRFWSCGHDSSCPDIREVRMIEDCDKAITNKADVFHSSFEDFQKDVCENVGHNLPLLKGEMRHHYTKGSTSVFFGWIISARMDLKQDNFITERALGSYAEPMAVFASLLGAPYPQGFVDTAYNWLLQNHGHDSIGGCSRDIIGQDMVYRTRQSRQISQCVYERALLDIVGSINLSKYSSEDMALVVFNPAAFARSEVMAASIEIPQEWKAGGFEIVDEKNKKINVQVLDKVAGSYPVVQSPNDTANTFPMVKYTVRAEFDDVPGLGYRTFFVKPVKAPRAQKPKTMLTGPQSMENELIAVTINSNGTLTINDKVTGKVYDKLGYFKDSSEIGNPWEHHAVAYETVYTTLNEKADVVLINDGELETSFRVTIDWALPEGRTNNDKNRSQHLKPYTIVNTVTLRKGLPWVEIVTNLDNTVEDHYLQAAFPSNIKSDKVYAQGQFDVVERSVFLPDPALYDEKVQSEQPMNSFVDISDGKVGLALLNEGMKAYESKDDPARTLSLTLLRSFPLRICVTQEMLDYSQIDKGSQCLGKHTFRYAVMPHAGDWQKAGLWQAADRFNLNFIAAETGPTQQGTEPLTKSFVELKPDNLVVSAVKRSESGQGWIVRLFNPFDKTVKGGIRFNRGFTGPTTSHSPVERIMANFALPDTKGKKWSTVRTVTLEEIPQKDLNLEPDGWVNIELGKKKILTIEFLP